MQNQQIQIAALLTVKSDGSYSHRSALKGYKDSRADDDDDDDDSYFYFYYVN
jgi:hypothetical protein